MLTFKAANAVTHVSFEFMFFLPPSVCPNHADNMHQTHRQAMCVFCMGRTCPMFFPCKTRTWLACDNIHCLPMGSQSDIYPRYRNTSTYWELSLIELEISSIKLKIYLHELKIFQLDTYPNNHNQRHLWFDLGLRISLFSCRDMCKLIGEILKQSYSY